MPFCYNQLYSTRHFSDKINNQNKFEKFEGWINGCQPGAGDQRRVFKRVANKITALAAGNKI